ncbi:MAG TPA: endolytic transglycosylase MltG, partial [Mycobacteriales bacterium]|nr:endolytic transglycosylase MltG [Mycobacteriales bacterium]
ITLASMIERETRIKAERPKVSRVIHNRLDAGTRLQIDATIQYLLPKPKKSLSAADLKIESPYNTYLHKGLPPGPIASPGRASIEAALAPADGPWLYYVVTDAKTGKHTFTASYEEFVDLKNKAKQDAGG